MLCDYILGLPGDNQIIQEARMYKAPKLENVQYVSENSIFPIYLKK